MAKILIVEDNINADEVLSEYFQEASHEIISVYDGMGLWSFFSEYSRFNGFEYYAVNNVRACIVIWCPKDKPDTCYYTYRIEDEYTQVSGVDCLAED